MERYFFQNVDFGTIHIFHYISLPGYPIRLVGGSSNSEGRVEVFYDGAWGTVCDDSWDVNDAGVVCRNLGFGTGSATTGASFGQGTGDIILDEVVCTGSEYYIDDCSHSGFGATNCDHSEDAGVICSGICDLHYVLQLAILNIAIV